MMVVMEIMVLVREMTNQVMLLPLSQLLVTVVSFIFVLPFKVFIFIVIYQRSSNCGAENGGGSANQQGKKLVISDEYFQRVTQALVMRLRQHEEAVMQEGKPYH